MLTSRASLTPGSFLSTLLSFSREFRVPGAVAARRLMLCVQNHLKLVPLPLFLLLFCTVSTPGCAGGLAECVFSGVSSNLFRASGAVAAPRLGISDKCSDRDVWPGKVVSCD